MRIFPRGEDDSWQVVIPDELVWIPYWINVRMIDDQPLNRIEVYNGDFIVGTSKGRDVAVRLRDELIKDAESQFAIERWKEAMSGCFFV